MTRSTTRSTRAFPITSIFRTVPVIPTGAIVPSKLRLNETGLLKGDVHIERGRGERDLLQASRNGREGGSPAEGPGPDAHDILHPEVLPDPVRRVVRVVDQQGAAPDIGYPKLPMKTEGELPW